MPLNLSVNNFMKETFSTFSYNTIDDVIKEVKPECYMATVDLQDAYCSVPIHASDRAHFGLRWDFGTGPTYLVDNFLCFGSKCSAFIFNRLTDAISRFMKRKGFCCFNYLDDFIIIGSSYEETCNAQRTLMQVLRKLGFYISWKKVISPTQYCRFLGIDIDAASQQLLLPDDKLAKLHREISFWEKKSTATNLQMQRLCGILNFCCKVIRGGRVYMYHMIQLLRLFKGQRRITLHCSFFDDLSWWSNFANNFNGCADFFNPEKDYINLYTDACLYGLAAICRNDFYQAKIVPYDNEVVRYHAIPNNAYVLYVPEGHAANINVLELIAILIALDRWSDIMRNCRIICHCDNLQVFYNLAKDKTKNPVLNACLRNIFWNCVKNNIYVSPPYIPSSCNRDADYLSRAIYF